VVAIFAWFSFFLKMYACMTDCLWLFTLWQTEQAAVEQQLGSKEFGLNKAKLSNKKARLQTQSEVWDWLHNHSCQTSTGASALETQGSAHDNSGVGDQAAAAGADTSVPPAAALVSTSQPPAAATTTSAQELCV
jgi:hypothetical protein